MKKYIFLLLSILSAPLNAAALYEVPNEFNTEEHKEGYAHKVFIGTKTHMDKLAENLKREGITIVRYKSGAIGYNSKDAERVNIILDEFIKQHFSGK
jgi:hypothetical protein